MASGAPVEPSSEDVVALQGSSPCVPCPGVLRVLLFDPLRIRPHSEARKLVLPFLLLIEEECSEELLRCFRHRWFLAAVFICMLDSKDPCRWMPISVVPFLLKESCCGDVDVHCCLTKVFPAGVGFWWLLRDWLMTWPMRLLAGLADSGQEAVELHYVAASCKECISMYLPELKWQSLAETGAGSLFGCQVAPALDHEKITPLRTPTKETKTFQLKKHTANIPSAKCTPEKVHSGIKYFSNIHSENSTPKTSNNALQRKVHPAKELQQDPLRKTPDVCTSEKGTSKIIPRF
ncbi:hypothetical protein Nepgr_033719 [Nepenthes gracilis]|uniref:Uncharacterized protein n=1 Tax=Nepenthes gracilis TaxID=150966 RepID=A0AAD3Y8K6_NEPGR|nr:hypothetical protein Nepgr_033719 [Nepenthes gracilis]